DDGVLGLQRVGQAHPVRLAGHVRSQSRPQRVVLGLVVDEQELLEELPPQGGSQQLARVVAGSLPDACHLHQFAPERVVQREPHADGELVLHVLSSIGISPYFETQSYLMSSFKNYSVCLDSWCRSRVGCRA